MFFTAIAVALLSGANVVFATEVSDALCATPTAHIKPGKIVGTTTSIPISPSGAVAVNKFLGIPYAKPPTGRARFSPPTPPSPWDSKDTKEFGASCIQVFQPFDPTHFAEQVYNNPPPQTSEDCLFINVFAPKKAWDPKAPPYSVLYWMYGGGWQFGNAGQPAYDGSHFAALEDVIVVTVNYRTNVFGLPQAPTISNVTNRNLALLDQRLGLQWVQDNIQHFGGDKNKVTIFGQSAGGFATDILVTSYAPNAPRPFRAAIMESGVYAYLLLGPCNNTDFTAWDALATQLNCANSTDAAQFECIKNERTHEQIKAAQENNTTAHFGFACDNKTIVSDPRTRLENGNTSNIPVMLGSNTADGSFYSSIEKFDVDKYFNDYFPGNDALKSAVLAAYPIGSEGRVDAQYQLQQIHTDWFFHCPTVWYGQTSTQFKPTYRYLFHAEFNSTRANASSWPAQYQGAYHASEITIVYSTYNASTADPDRDALSNTMRHAWASFAKDPSKPPIQNWPRLGQGSNGADVMDFGIDKKARFGPVVDSNKCDVWEKLGFRTFHA